MARILLALREAIFPLPFVVRFTVGSFISMRCWSAVARTSNSRNLDPRAAAAESALTPFSLAPVPSPRLAASGHTDARAGVEAGDAAKACAGAATSPAVRTALRTTALRAQPAAARVRRITAAPRNVACRCPLKNSRRRHRPAGGGLEPNRRAAGAVRRETASWRGPGHRSLRWKDSAASPHTIATHSATHARYVKV